MTHDASKPDDLAQGSQTASERTAPTNTETAEAEQVARSATRDAGIAVGGAQSRRDRSAWHGWLPSLAQIRSAFLLDLRTAIDGDLDAATASRPDAGAPAATSMRQGLGLIGAAALLAGLLPFLFQLTLALNAGATVLFARIARGAASMAFLAPDAQHPLTAITEAMKLLGGLEPLGPGWLAALLSALGLWLNWPLTWIASWILYGLGMLVIAKFLGATTTLQRFYAGIAYACLPLLLLSLSPLPYIGGLLALVGLIWSLVVLVQAVRVVTGFGLLRGLTAAVSPLLIALLLAWVLMGAVMISVFRLFV